MNAAPDTSLKINEIFYSIQGESSFAGWPTVFIRTSACNLRCTYCDTTYAYYQGDMMTLAAIIAEVKSYQTKHVCLTGGEPLLQKNSLELMRTLCDLGYIVSLETSGSLDCTPVDARVRKIIDVKTPDSGAADSFLLENLKFNDVNTEFKFVICSEADFSWAENFSKTHCLFDSTTVFYSPAFRSIEEKWLAEKILAQKSSARLQLQLHKYIWSPHTRGV
jgi:7-carboxy-7-deazaguanine synthase